MPYSINTSSGSGPISGSVHQHQWRLLLDHQHHRRTAAPPGTSRPQSAPLVGLAGGDSLNDADDASISELCAMVYLRTPLSHFKSFQIIISSIKSRISITDLSSPDGSQLPEELENGFKYVALLREIQLCGATESVVINHTARESSVIGHFDLAGVPLLAVERRAALVVPRSCPDESL